MTQPQSFGKYTLEKKLATGGMAEVWLARQTGIEGFNRHVVIKRILPHLAEDPDFVQMFLNEAKIASRFNHPNIGQIYDLGETGGTYFISMEFIHGEDLGRIMRRAYSTGQWLARAISIRIIADACAGLHYAHTRSDEQGRPLKVVHRDISPQNILVSFDGSVKLVDFGIAKAANQVSNTQSGALKGKFAYMSPEQAAGKPLDGRSDLFALGLVLYELLTGVRALKRDSELATLQAAMECQIEAPSVVAEVPAELDDVVMRALARSPDDRYRDARQMQMALEQLLVAEGTVATSVQVSELMEHLFADRLAEEAKSGAPAPATASSVSNVMAQGDVAEALRRAAETEGELPTKGTDGQSRRAPGPNETLGDEDDGDDVPPPPITGPLTVAARTPARPAPRPEPAPRHTVEYRPPRSASRSAPAPQSTSEDLPRDLADDEGVRDPDLGSPDREPPAPVVDPSPPRPPRRSTTGSVRRRSSSSSSSMPDAPPPRTKSRSSVSRAALPPKPRDSLAEYGEIVDVDTLRRRSIMRTLALLVVLLMVGAGVMALLFRDRLPMLLRTHGMIAGGVPVLLSVTSSPPTKVTVVPSAASGSSEVRELGFTTLDRVSGAYVGDTVVLTNVDRGIHYERIIDSGRANEVITIDKTFKETNLRVKTKPALKGATVWLNNLQIGRVGTAIKVFEGKQTFEVRADDLLHPIEFEVNLDPAKPLHDQEVDVSGAVTGTSKNR